MLYLSCDFGARKCENCDFVFLLLPIRKIGDPQQLNLCTRAFSTGVKVGYFINEIYLFVNTDKVIKLKI